MELKSYDCNMQSVHFRHCCSALNCFAYLAKTQSVCKKEISFLSKLVILCLRFCHPLPSLSICPQKSLKNLELLETCHLFYCFNKKKFNLFFLSLFPVLMRTLIRGPPVLVKLKKISCSQGSRLLYLYQ